jgi:hypothetical protein
MSIKASLDFEDDESRVVAEEVILQGDSYKPLPLSSKRALPDVLPAEYLEDAEPRELLPFDQFPIKEAKKMKFHLTAEKEPKGSTSWFYNLSCNEIEQHESSTKVILPSSKYQRIMASGTVWKESWDESNIFHQRILHEVRLSVSSMWRKVLADPIFPYRPDLMSRYPTKPFSTGSYSSSKRDGSGIISHCVANVFASENKLHFFPSYYHSPCTAS